MDPKISIIVPVYKAEAYLSRCVDSLLAQTLPDFELLLVDDGSPDCSGALCDQYAERDKRVRAFHKENGGVSSARQYGLDHAHGEYVIHADPDDWVEPDMLESLYRKAKEEDADMVICDFYEELGTKQIYKRQQPPSLNHDTILRALLSQQIHGACWNKLVRRSCFEKYHVSFPSKIIRWEDLYVHCNLLLNPLRLTYLSKAFYHYDRYTNEESIVRRVSISGFESQLYFVQYFEDKLPANDYEDELFAIKKATLELAFTSKLLTNHGFHLLYPEIHGRYLHLKGQGLLGLCIRLKLRKLDVLSGFYWGVYCRFYQWFKRRA